MEKRLHVESPLDGLDDVASGAFNYNLVKQHFKLAFRLMQSQGAHSKSILTHIISDKVYLYITSLDQH